MNKNLQIDLMDTEVQKCPYDAYATLRQECPVYQMPSTGQYLVTRYDDLREVLRQPELYSNQLPLAQRRPGGPNPDVAAVYRDTGWEPTKTLQRTDPPVHKRYRQYIDRTFTASRVRKLAPYVDAMVDQLIDDFIDKGEAEFVSEFAVPLPCLIIADQFGLARTDAPKLKHWSDAAMEALGLMISPEREVECAQIAVEAQHYFAEQFEARQKAPRDDMMSDLVRPMQDGDGNISEPMTMQELLDMMSQLLNGGNQTTTSSLAIGLKLLIEHPEQMALLRDDASLMGNFVEEVLRLETPVQGLFRVATTDTTLSGTAIPEGSILMLLYGSANRDEEKFDHEDSFNIQRRNAGAHLAFGAGAHFCPGAMLARQEMASAFTGLFARLDNIQFAQGANSFSFPPSLVHRNLENLHITFDKKAT